MAEIDIYEIVPRVKLKRIKVPPRAAGGRCR